MARKDDGAESRAMGGAAVRTEADRAASSRAYSEALRDYALTSTSYIPISAQAAADLGLTRDPADAAELRRLLAAHLDAWVEEGRVEIEWAKEQRRLEDVVIDEPKDGKRDSA